MGMGGGGGQTQTTQQQPPGYAMPYIGQGLQNVAAFTDPRYAGTLPQQQVEPFSPLQQQGFGMFPGIANAADRLGGNAMGTAGDILSGKYLSPSSNPYLKQYADQAAQGMINQYQTATAPGITAEAVRSGGLGGSGQNQAEQYGKWGLGQNLSNLYAGIYEPAYAQDLSQMTSALGMTPSLQQGAFTPGQELLGVGGQQQQQGQNQLNTAYQNAMNQINYPRQLLSQYVGDVAQLGGMGSNARVNLGGGGSMK